MEGCGGSGCGPGRMSCRPPAEGMNSPQQPHEVRLRGLGGPSVCGVPGTCASATWITRPGLPTHDHREVYTLSHAVCGRGLARFTSPGEGSLRQVGVHVL